MMAEQEIPQALEPRSAKRASQSARCPVVVVSNEVGQGITPDNAMARAFVTYQGRPQPRPSPSWRKRCIFVTAGLRTATQRLAYERLVLDQARANP